MVLVDKIDDCQALVDELVKTDKKQLNEKPGFTAEIKKLLKIEFAKKQKWNKDFRYELAKRFGLKPIQIYKWHYDQVHGDKRSKKWQLLHRGNH